MFTYRVTVQVTLDVEAEDDDGAMAVAMQNVSARIGDDRTTPLHERTDAMWVTGIAERDYEYFCYKQPFPLWVIDKSEDY